MRPDPKPPVVKPLTREQKLHDQQCRLEAALGEMAYHIRCAEESESPLCFGVIKYQLWVARDAFDTIDNL